MSDLYERAATFFGELQAEICAALETVDGSAHFREDVWQREGGGGGVSRVIEGGGLFEKAGVNWSSVEGELPEDFAGQLPAEGRDFRATGVSLVLHPRSPMVPTVHANFRYLEKGDQRWFGGVLPVPRGRSPLSSDAGRGLRSPCADRRLPPVQDVVRRVLLPSSSRRDARRRRHLLRLPGRWRPRADVRVRLTVRSRSAGAASHGAWPSAPGSSSGAVATSSST
jgi:hypothetical protein